MSNINWNRLLSLVVALTYLVTGYISGGGEALLKTALFLILPMAAIWYGDTLGEFTGIMTGAFSSAPITKSSPGFLVAVAGWILLLSPVVAIAIIKYSGS